MHASRLRAYCQQVAYLAVLLLTPTVHLQIVLRQWSDVRQICENHLSSCHAQCYPTYSCTASADSTQRLQRLVNQKAVVA